MVSPIEKFKELRLDVDVQQLSENLRRAGAALEKGDSEEAEGWLEGAREYISDIEIGIASIERHIAAVLR